MWQWKNIAGISAAKISFWPLHDLENRLFSPRHSRPRLIHLFLKFFLLFIAFHSLSVCMRGYRRFQTKNRTTSINKFLAFWFQSYILCNNRPSEKAASCVGVVVGWISDARGEHRRHHCYRPFQWRIHVEKEKQISTSFTWRSRKHSWTLAHVEGKIVVGCKSRDINKTLFILLFICWCCGVSKHKKIERQKYSRREEKNMKLMKKKHKQTQILVFSLVSRWMLHHDRYFRIANAIKKKIFYSSRDNVESIDIEQRLIIHSRQAQNTT